jgi:hypothetical protein
MANLDELRKLFEEATGRVGDAVDEYNATPSPSAGALRPFFGLSSVETKTSSPEMDAFLARMDAVRDRRDAEAAFKLPPVKAREDTPREGVPSALRPSNWVTARAAFSGLSQPKTNGESVEGLGVVPAPPPMGIRPPVEAGPTLTAPSVPVVSRDTAPAVKAPEAQSIPVASVSTKADVPTVAASALAPTGPQNPAPPAGTSSTVKPPPVDAGSGGDDALGRLSIGQALTRALEGSGSVISGQNLRSGAADTLGDRMKQIEALRAKREERAMELAREDEQSSALVQQYKSLAAQGLVPELPALDRLPPKQAAGLIKTYGSLPGLVQKTEKTKAEIPLVQAKTATEQGKPEIAKGGLEVKRETLVERERSNKANEDIRRQALLLKKASDTKTASEIRAAGSDPKAAEKAITRAMETAEKKDLGIASNIRDFQGLEAVAPGFTKGIVPSWLGQGSIAAAIEVPGLNKQATQLASALELFTAGIRHSLFGASLTGNEKASFDAIVSSGVLMPPEVLAANINRLREGAAKFAQNHFTVAQELHPEVTGRVLRASPLFGPATREGGVYSDVWLLSAGASPVSGAGPAAPAPAAQVGGMVKVRHKASGKTATVDRAKADEMLKRPDFEEVN